MLKSMQKNGITLALFAFVCTALVVGTHQLTQKTIAKQQQKEKLNTLSALLPSGSYDNDVVATCRLITNKPYLGDDQPHALYRATKNGQTSAYALETVAPNGYSGAIKLIVGFDNKGVVSGVRVLAHKETPGLGDKIELKKSRWIESFNGKALTEQNRTSWAVKKDGGEFDAFTGATITPRAVVGAVKNVLLLAQQQPALLDAGKPCVSGSESP